MKRILYAFIFTSIILLNASPAEAKTKNPFIYPYGVSLNCYANGNGFDPGFVPEMVFGLGQKFTLAAGPRFAMTGGKVSGFVTDLRYYVLKEEDTYSKHFTLSAFFSTQYFKKCQLSAKAVRIEEIMHAKTEILENPDYAGIRFTGYSFVTGVGTSYAFNRNLRMHVQVGLGYYDTHQLNRPELELSREPNTLCLSLSGGLEWTFGNKNHRARSL